MKMANSFCSALGRKKPLIDEESKLARVLNLFDLTALGVGSTLGVGVYVLAGAVAKNESGPAACLSFLVAAIASAAAGALYAKAPEVIVQTLSINLFDEFVGICYAEFASRVPKAGSAYVYCYVTVGEFSAFIIGWNLILEYVIGTASVARALSNYIDALVGNVIEEKLTAIMPIRIAFMSPYPDFLSFAFVLVLTGLLIVGVKESTFLNNIFTVLNLCTVATVIVVGIMNININYWKIPKEEIPPQFAATAGEGGFLPFGMAGVMTGAAKCFYGYVGFDCVATTSEEAKNPKRNIPIAICLSLLIIFASYFGMSMVLTLMWPYYDQDPKAPFPYVLEQLNYPTIKLIVTGGAIFALCTSMLGAMFPLPRVIYAMAEDGLLFKIFAKVNPRTKTPAQATILSGLLSGVMAALFDLDQLINMMSIGTLLAYTIVAICVLILRYVPLEETFMPQENAITMRTIGRKVLNLNNNRDPTQETSIITNSTLLLYCLLSSFFCSTVIYYLNFSDGGSTTLFVFLLLGMIVTAGIIYRQPQTNADLTFKVPLVPLIPLLSIVFNMYLMLELDLQTWIRFIVWLVIGFVIYFGYGIRYSKIPSSPEPSTPLKYLQASRNNSRDNITASNATIMTTDSSNSTFNASIDTRQRHLSSN